MGNFLGAMAGRDLRSVMAAGMIGLAAAALWNGPAGAEDQKVIVSHGISTFGALKLPAEFTHLP